MRLLLMLAALTPVAPRALVAQAPLRSSWLQAISPALSPEALRFKAPKLAEACRFVPGRVREEPMRVQVSQVYLLR
jgi:hypothetical protein